MAPTRCTSATTSTPRTWATRGTRSATALLATIIERSRGLAAMGYRMNADPSVAWPHVALDPTHNDDALVTAAFTLARIDASLAVGPQKMQLEQLHDQLWQRISRSNAPYLNVPA